MSQLIKEIDNIIDSLVDKTQLLAEKGRKVFGYCTACDM